MQIAKSNFYLHFNFDFLLNYGNFLGSANVLTWWACEMRCGEQHTRDTIRLVPLHLMLLSWMQNAEKERLFEKNNKLQTEKWASFKKIVFRSKKLLFQPFFLNCINENGFLKQLFSILLNILLHNTNCFKKPFSFLQFTKKAQKAIFWSKIHFL